MNILLFILLAVTVAWGLRLFLQRAPKYGPRFLIYLGLIIAVVALIIMAATGRLHWLIGVLAGLFPLLKRLLPWALLKFLPALKWPGNGHQPTGTSGQQSSVNTDLLAMTLDHDTGDMDGEVLTGPYQHKWLSALTIPELYDIYQHCQRYDYESLRLLESYLQRHHQQEWEQFIYQQGGSSENDDNHTTNSDNLSVDEALEILGLGPNPTEDEIHKAHKRLMAKFHPDRGGSHYMAVKINQAKDLLLSQR